MDGGGGGGGVRKRGGDHTSYIGPPSSLFTVSSLPAPIPAVSLQGLRSYQLDRAADKSPHT